MKPSSKAKSRKAPGHKPKRVASHPAGQAAREAPGVKVNLPPAVPHEVRARVLDGTFTPSIFDLADGAYTDGFARDIEALPCLRLEAAPCRVPPELDALPPDARVRYRSFDPRAPDGFATATALAHIIREQMERQAAGFFTIDEAAWLLARQAPRSNSDAMARRLIDAGAAGRLPLRSPEDKLPMNVGPDDTGMPWLWACLLSAGDVDAWLSDSGVPYRLRTTAAPPATPGKPPDVVHRAKNTKTEPLTAVLELAADKAVDRNDWQAVWFALVALAAEPQPPAPLLGTGDTGEVKWQTEDGPVRFLTRENVRDRWRRRKR